MHFFSLEPLADSHTCTQTDTLALMHTMAIILTEADSLIRLIQIYIHHFRRFSNKSISPPPSSPMPITRNIGLIVRAATGGVGLSRVRSERKSKMELRETKRAALAAAVKSCASQKEASSRKLQVSSYF